LFIYLAVDIGRLPEGYLPQWNNPDPEYIYQLHKTFVVHKDPIQTTQYNATVSCYFNQPNSLYCVLNFVNVFTTVTRDNITMEITNTQLPGSDWFKIKFNNHGIEEILVNETTNRKDIIKDIASLFDIGDDLTNKVLLPRTTFVATEETVVGSCSTTYDISAEYEEYRGRQKTYINKEDFHPHFHIILSEITKHSSNWTNENLRILIEKNRSHCSSSHLQNYFPEIEVVRTHFFIYVLYFLLSPFLIEIIKQLIIVCQL